MRAPAISRRLHADRLPLLWSPTASGSLPRTPYVHDLYFERFLNPARATPPDIDTDICSRGRDLVIQHAFDHYGADRVAMVATINHFRPKSALSDLAKARGLAPELVRELGGMLPHAFWSRREESETGEGEKSPFAEALTAYPKLAGLFREAESLLKIPRHLSVHPGGLVVSPGAMTDRMAVMHSGSKGIVITQMDLEAVEALGLVKIDLLGIRGLSVMGDVAAAIRSWRRSEFTRSLDVLESISETDAQTADCVENGKTIGCFQIESPGMRGVLREIHARTPQDILAALALYRPGPLQGGLKDAFVRRFKGQEPVSSPASGAGAASGGHVWGDSLPGTGSAHRQPTGGFQPGRGRFAAPGDEPF